MQRKQDGGAQRGEDDCVNVKLCGWQRHTQSNRHQTSVLGEVGAVCVVVGGGGGVHGLDVAASLINLS